MREIIGFEEGDSILAPGGSISNMYALIVARHRYFPEAKNKGISGISEPVAIYTSEQVSSLLKHGFQTFKRKLFFQCHYSIKGGAATIGIGLESVFSVPCDEKYEQRA